MDKKCKTCSYRSYGDIKVYYRSKMKRYICSGFILDSVCTRCDRGKPHYHYKEGVKHTNRVCEHSGEYIKCVEDK